LTPAHPYPADLTRPFLLFCLTLYSLALLPTFHYLWLYSGSGNANFFYASTLVWALSQGGLLLDVFGAYGTREVLRGLGKEGRQEVAAERWHIVQR
jgi:phosphatidylinositol glycan class U